MTDLNVGLLDDGLYLHKMVHDRYANYRYTNNNANIIYEDM